MNTTDNLDQQLRSTFAATAPKREPDGLFESVMSGTTSVGQRRPLMVRTRELVELPTVRWPAFRAALIALGTIVILLLAFGAALFIGSRLPDPPSIVHGEFTVTGPLNVDPGLEVVVRSSVALPDGRILVIGTSLTRTAGDFAERPWAAVYEPASGTFSETGAPSIARSLSTLTTLADGRVLLAGGFLTPEMFEDPEQAALADPASAEIWDPANGRFERTGQMSVGRYGHTATLLPDGRVLLAGGELDATAELYDPQTGAFHAVNDKMSTARLYAAAAQLADGRVLVTGGSTGDSVSSGAELFDPSTQTFSVVGPMAVGRAEHTATTLGDGRVLVAGGGLLSSSGFLAGDATPAAELFDPASGAFEAVGPMTTERTLHAAARVGDRVLIVGGQNIDGSPRTAELFDPATGSFLQAGRAPAGDYDTTASLLPDGDVLVTAGAAAPVVWTAAEISAPDPVGNAPAGPGFSTLEWPTLRYGQTATTLADGRVLIAGGRDSRSGESSAAAELFDPRTGATTAIRMQLAHSDHAAVRLDDGRVLIVGGAEPAELFDPTTATFETTDSPRLPAPGSGSGPPTSDACVGAGQRARSGAGPRSPWSVGTGYCDLRPGDRIVRRQARCRMPSGRRPGAPARRSRLPTVWPRDEPGNCVRPDRGDADRDPRLDRLDECGSTAVGPGVGHERQRRCRAVRSAINVVRHVPGFARGARRRAGARVGGRARPHRGRQDRRRLESSPRCRAVRPLDRPVRGHRTNGRRPLQIGSGRAGRWPRADRRGKPSIPGPDGSTGERGRDVRSVPSPLTVAQWA
jgi:hypothetical protein